jgi:glyoxylase-like metal-dependent hydrolase (beta-lactamase superfamily II)
MSELYQRVGAGIFAIDTEYVRARMDASHLIVDDGHAAFVDTGTYHSVPHLLAALAALDIDTDAVDYILLTHVHLDHAGGVGRLAAVLPRARVLVHPRGAAHIIDPTRLIAATKAVYGERVVAERYGEISAVPAQRVRAVDDGERITLGGRRLEFLHTPGHAMHHVCIADRDSHEIFAGDTFGVSYREFDTAAGEFIVPTTTPTQFDPVQLHASVSRLQRLEPGAVYLTHYSRVGHVDKLAVDLHSDIDAHVAIAQSAAAAPDRIAQMQSRIFDHWSKRLDAHGFDADSARRHELLDADAALNAAGLDAWLARTAS